MMLSQEFSRRFQRNYFIEHLRTIASGYWLAIWQQNQAFAGRDEQNISLIT